MILTSVKLMSLTGQTLVFGESNACVWQSKFLGSIRRTTVNTKLLLSTGICRVVGNFRGNG